MTKVTKVAKLDPLSTVLKSFGNSVSNDNYQSTDNHMVKFKG